MIGILVFEQFLDDVMLIIFRSSDVLLIQVPVKADIMAVIPWNKMQHRMFGINSHGIFSISKDTGKVNSH